MAITRYAAVATRTGTTTLDVSGIQYEAGIAVNDLYFWYVQSKYDPNLPSFDGTLTAIAQVTGGAGAAGANSGPVTLTNAYRVIASTGESSSIHQITLASGNSLAAKAQRLRIGSGNSWDIASTSVAVNTAKTSWAEDGAAALHLKTGDLLFCCIALNKTMSTTAFASRALSATGITFDTISLDQVNNIAVGDGMYGWTVSNFVTAGDATVVPRFTGSAVESCSGVVTFVRFREVAPVSDLSGSAALGDITASGTLAPQPDSSLSGSATLGDITASGTLGVAPGVITTPVLKNNTGTILASVSGVVANVYNPTTGALVVRKTGLSSNGSGIVAITDAALVPGTSYVYEIDLSAASLGRRLPVGVAA